MREALLRHAAALGDPLEVVRFGVDDVDEEVGLERERAVEVARVVDGLAARGRHARSGHDVLGESLGPFDTGGIGGRSEHRDTDVA